MTFESYISLKDMLMPRYKDAAQPGTIYYANKLKTYVYGIVAPCTNQKQIYLINENNIGKNKKGKDANLKMNFILQ